MSDYEIPVKCMACSLHFTIWSETDLWKAEEICCPECGVRGSKMIWKGKPIEGFIFQKVPGDAELVGIG